MALWTYSSTRSIALSKEVDLRVATRCELRGAGATRELVYAEDHPIRVYCDALDLGHLIEPPEERPGARFAVVAQSDDPALRNMSE